MDNDWYACFGAVLCRWLAWRFLYRFLRVLCTAGTERQTKNNVPKKPSENRIEEVAPTEDRIWHMEIRSVVSGIMSSIDSKDTTIFHSQAFISLSLCPNADRPKRFITFLASSLGSHRRGHSVLTQARLFELFVRVHDL